MNPPIKITDPRFKYVDSAHTDVAATFARVRKEQEIARRLAEQGVYALRGAVPLLPMLTSLVEELKS